MRRMLVIAAAIVAVGYLSLRATPLHTLLFPPATTPHQREIIHRANAGLAWLAAKSPTAATFYRQVQQHSRWPRSPLVVSREPAQRHSQPFSVLVMRSDWLHSIAFYLNPTRTVCFIEQACDSMGRISLGLTYAHELGHRQDFQRGIVSNFDLEGSRPERISEAGSILIELIILNEITEGCWLDAVDRHIRRYDQQPQHQRKKFTVQERSFAEDATWLRQEFGCLNKTDQRMLTNYLLLNAKFRSITRGKKLTYPDSLECMVGLLPTK